MLLLIFSIRKYKKLSGDSDVARDPGVTKDPSSRDLQIVFKPSDPNYEGFASLTLKAVFKPSDDEVRGLQTE